MDTVQAIKLAFYEVNEAVKALREYVLEQPVVASHFFEIPPVAREGIRNVTTAINVTPVAMPIAVSACTRAYGRFFMANDLSTSYSGLYPGVVQLPAACRDDLAALLLQVEHKKHQFKALITGARKQGQARWELVHEQAFAGELLMTLHVYRQIPALLNDSIIQSVGWTWKRQPVREKMPRGEMTTRIAIQKETTDDPLLEQVFADAITVLNRFAEDRMVYKFYPDVLVPMVNVKRQAPVPANVPAKQMKAGHLPLLICSDAPIRYNLMRSYVPNGGRVRNDGRAAKWRSVYSPLSLYVAD
ncbi:hypothetical protein IC617_08760 [Neiella sp. HB171785]|uniref:DNA replication terminus site-binding protein n=1 Tax=Neiella litorisoli TaxID=2771431 RepID=A0A8J6QJ72_9GAMM|nr:DNA replication terminus site-binding protein [Neiella litorisoli]MBD1389517.1 hypothetical protein [Neiella litorisoli]